MKKLFTWLDQYILTIFSIFLFLFVPLYPKLPLMELITGYIVRVRIEDFIILAAFLILIIQVLRKKAVLRSVVFWPIVIYLGIGFLSCLSAIFITKTVPWDWIHIFKLFLHWLRRIEYFSIFFIFYNGALVLRKKQFFYFLSLVLVSLIALYGYGQKYLYWPVYSTMNREFSKGIKLYLTQHARVPSTFGGHYDLAAFLVIFLLLFVSFMFLVKDKRLKIGSLIAFLLAYWLLILSASRTSFIAYVVGLTCLFAILVWKKGWRWSGLRWAGVMLFSFFIMIFFGDLSERFAHLLKLTGLRDKLVKFVQPIKAPPVAKDYLAFDPNLPLVLDRTDERPVEYKPGEGLQGGESELPPDVYEKLPDYREVTISGQLEATTATKRVTVERSFSENAYKYGLSAAIRMDALWPQAINGFKTNPLLGSGYSTLTKSSVGQFTEAESTDNDYLRALGETGLLGFLSFYGIIFIILKTLVNFLKRTLDTYLLAFATGFIAFTIGLLVNAIYIDVFEASKVAFSFWSLTGIILALISQIKSKNLNFKRK